MGPTDFIALLAGVMMILGTGLYLSQGIRQSNKAPVLATWIMFAIATSLSLWMYLHSEGHSWMTNVGNLVDPLLCWTATVVLAVYSRRRWGRVVYNFDFFQLSCLFVSTLIVAFWLQTEDTIKANLAIQCIIVVGYLPTYARLARAKGNTEPTRAWVCQTIGSFLANIPAWLGHDTLAKVYAGRASICLTVLFVFMYFAHRRGTRKT